MKKTFFSGLFVLLFLLAARQASAHAVVSPKEANVGAFTNFSLGVPSEKPISTVKVKLVIPDGLNYVTPYVKPGWKIEVKQKPLTKDGKPVMTDDGTQAQVVNEIDWIGGSIPAGQKDQFLFSAQVPATATTLEWRVYQTYQDGSLVSWDQDANNKELMKAGFNTFGPYSTTKVIDDLTAAKIPEQSVSNNYPNQGRSNMAMVLSVIALIVSLVAIVKKSK